MADRRPPFWRLLRLRLSALARRRAAVHRERRRLVARLPSPREVLRRDWRAVAAGVWRATNQNDLFLLAAAVAFFSFLSLFPALTLLVSVYGLVADPVDVSRQLEASRSVLPAGGFTLVEARLRALAESPTPSLGLSVALSALFGTWSSMRGARALIVACNRIYHRQERRGFVALQGVSLGLTLFGLAYASLAILFLVLLPAALRLLPRAPFLVGLAGYARCAVAPPAPAELGELGLGARHGALAPGLGSVHHLRGERARVLRALRSARRRGRDTRLALPLGHERAGGRRAQRRAASGRGAARTRRGQERPGRTGRNHSLSYALSRL
jgi:hypothetical protein